MRGLLLAAGLGTRFRPFTDRLPKPAIPLLNVPIAFYNLHLMQQLGLKSLTVNVHHLPHEIANLFSARAKLDIPLHFSDESQQILGTAGAIKKVAHTIWSKQKAEPGPFIMANADVVNGFGVHDALEFHREKKPLATMIVMEHPEVGTKYGAVWVDAQNRVIGIGRQKPTQLLARPLHFVGIHFIEDRIIDFIPDGPCDISSVYMDAIAKGETVYAFEKTGLWFDAGTLGDYLAATMGLLALLPKIQHYGFFLSLFRRYWSDFDQRPNLWEGQNSEHLLPLGTSTQIVLGSRCRIHPDTRITGFGVFGEGAVVEKDVELENVVVRAGLTVPQGTRASNTIILE